MRRFALIKSSRKARYLHYPFSIFNSPFLFVCKNLSEVFVYKQTQTALIQLSHLTEHEEFILMVHTADGICGFPAGCRSGAEIRLRLSQCAPRPRR